MLPEKYFINCFLVPSEQVHELPPNMNLEQGALCEPMSCILHGWKRLQSSGSLKADSKILVLGAGIIGNLWMSLLHHFGHRKVIVSEPSHDRRNIADGLSKLYLKAVQNFISPFHKNAYHKVDPTFFHKIHFLHECYKFNLNISNDSQISYEYQD